MTLDSYRNFVTIVDCGSIVAAANKLLIAQPSLSNQLKNIEKTYGAKLLLRGNRSLELTDAYSAKTEHSLRMSGALFR